MIKKLFLLVLCLPMASSLVFAAAKVEVNVVYLARDVEPFIPLSLLDVPIEDEGVQGARLAMNDNSTTGGFLGHEYLLEEVLVAPDADLVARYNELVKEGHRLFLFDLDAKDIASLTGLHDDVLLFNVRAWDDELRNEGCHPTLFHMPPSRAMLSDALAQYLSTKRWDKVVLVSGRHQRDEQLALSMRRSMKRFGIKIVDEKQWTAVPGARRTDSGHHNAQQEIPVFTEFRDYDVLLVADEGDEFGEHLPYLTRRPRPVAGTQGLTPTAWHRSQEQWGATQVQRRFEKQSARWMTDRDYTTWLAVRVLGEAVTNTNGADPAALREFMLSDRFKLAGFKGVPLTFRDWNGQLRQPVLVVGPRMLVTVSPQKGFLHERSELDTLGFDKPESTCSAFAG